MQFNFEKLEVYQEAVEFAHRIYWENPRRG